MAVALGVLTLAAGCGAPADPTPEPTTEAYSGPRTCGVDPALITAVAGTDDYTAESTLDDRDPTAELPAVNDQHHTYMCRVSVHDAPELTLVALFDPDQAEDNRGEIAEKPGRFEYAEGSGSVHADGTDWAAVWVCGDVVAGVSPPMTGYSTLQPSTDVLRALVQAFADQAGCFERS